MFRYMFIRICVFSEDVIPDVYPRPKNITLRNCTNYNKTNKYDRQLNLKYTLCKIPIHLNV